MKLKKLFSWLSRLFKYRRVSRKNTYSFVVVKELPKEIDDKILYIEGDESTKDFWYALLKCPCGCTENIMLNLMTDAKPLWELSINKNDFSITPSIWRTGNCESHFWLKNSNIVWA